MSEPAGMSPSAEAGRGPAPAFLAEHGPRVLVAALIARRVWYHIAAIVSSDAEPVIMRLCSRLALVALGFWLFHRSVRGQFGARAADLSLAVLLAYPELAFFENKELPVSIAVVCTVVALWGMCRLLPGHAESPESGDVASSRLPLPTLLLAGFCAGLSLLAVPYMLAGLPLFLGSIWILARSRRSAAAPWALAFSLGLGLAFGAEALREELIGERPPSLSIAGVQETLRALPDVSAWEPARLWSAAGNDLWRSDPELRAEMEQTFVVHHIGLPFGALLALGYLGCAALLRRAVRVRAERARRVALALALGGQIAALILWASLSGAVGTRVLLCVPLAFVAGPALLALLSWSWRGSQRAGAWQLGWVSLFIGALLFAQAYWPRT